MCYKGERGTDKVICRVRLALKNLLLDEYHLYIFFLQELPELGYQSDSSETDQLRYIKYIDKKLIRKIYTFIHR